MIFREMALSGAFVVEPEPIADERGYFARTFCRREFAERGLAAEYVQQSVSFNRPRGTLRGMHLQAPPHAEDKLVACVAGAIYDVIVDLREGSPSFAKWTAIELAAGSHRWLYVPRGFAHGFLTLCDDSEVLYQMSVPHVPGAARGFCFDDPRVGIAWPEAPRVVSARDRTWPGFTPESFRA